MTPASLKRNYIEEIKKCGDTLYKKDQYWEWVPLSAGSKAIDTLSTALGLTVAYIKKKKGVWLVDHNKESNLDNLSAKQIMSLDEQLDEMIKTKYQFISYNGLRREKFKAMTSNYDVRPSMRFLNRSVFFTVPLSPKNITSKSFKLSGNAL